jgi:hypothetical protein
MNTINYYLLFYNDEIIGLELVKLEGNPYFNFAFVQAI